MSRIEYQRSVIAQALQHSSTTEGCISLAHPEGQRIFRESIWSMSESGLQPAGTFDIPQFRKYQNKHIAPTRMWVGGGMMAAGGIMMIMGYRQDNKYEWSGPYPSLSPLNVFGALVIAAGIGFLASGLLFHAKFKKHTITPYHKAY